MLVLTTTTAQILAPGQAITFDEVLIHSGCGECFRKQVPTSVKLRGTGLYQLSFSGNIGTTTGTGTSQLAMAFAENANNILPETRMNAVTATADNTANVSTLTEYKNSCGDFDRISVVNSGAGNVTVAAGACFVIKRDS